LPTTLPPGLALGAVGEREDPRDAVLFRAGAAPVAARSLAELPVGACSRGATGMPGAPIRLSAGRQRGGHLVTAADGAAAEGTPGAAV